MQWCAVSSLGCNEVLPTTTMQCYLSVPALRFISLTISCARWSLLSARSHTLSLPVHEVDHPSLVHTRLKTLTTACWGCSMY